MVTVIKRNVWVPKGQGSFGLTELEYKIFILKIIERLSVDSAINFAYNHSHRWRNQKG